ncbi:MAG: hypothetical protein JRJ27_15230 [Deltaproteobacteria bacterium]|nr:hypothetical protein [Deltaproteobacteria bacterium]
MDLARPSLNSTLNAMGKRKRHPIHRLIQSTIKLPDTFRAAKFQPAWQKAEPRTRRKIDVVI